MSRPMRKKGETIVEAIRRDNLLARKLEFPMVKERDEEIAILKDEIKKLQKVANKTDAELKKEIEQSNQKIQGLEKELKEKKEALRNIKDAQKKTTPAAVAAHNEKRANTILRRALAEIYKMYRGKAPREINLAQSFIQGAVESINNAHMINDMLVEEERNVIYSDANTIIEKRITLPLVAYALWLTNNNQSIAHKILGISRNTLRERIDLIKTLYPDIAREYDYRDKEPIKSKIMFQD